MNDHRREQLDRRQPVLSGARSQGPSRRAIKGVVGIITGASIAQVLAISAIPVLARLYSPEETARYALLLGIGMVVASFASLRLNLAIPLPSKTEDSQQLFWLACVVPLLVVPITGAVAAAAFALDAPRPPGFRPLDFLLIGAFVFLLSVFTAARQYGVRVRAYRTLSRVPVVQMGITLCSQFALGWVGFGGGLFAGGLIGRSAGIAGLMNESGLTTSRKPEITDARRLLREYWRFPVFLAPAALINVLGANIAALMLPSLYGLGAAGLYAMAFRVAAVPATIVSDSVGQVFLGEFARMPDGSGARAVFIRWSVALFALGAFVAGAMWFLAPVVLPTLLGEEWVGTATLAQYTGVMAGAAIVGSPLQNVWTVRQRVIAQLAWNCLRLAAIAGTIWATADSGAGIETAAGRLAMVSSAVYALSWAGCLWASGRPSLGRPSKIVLT